MDSSSYQPGTKANTNPTLVLSEHPSVVFLSEDRGMI